MSVNNHLVSQAASPPTPRPSPTGRLYGPDSWLSNFGNCGRCGASRTWLSWCKSCESKAYRAIFDCWTSGDEQVDEFLRHLQLTAESPYQAIEWIPFDELENIKFRKEGGNSTIYTARWIVGPRFRCKGGRWVPKGPRIVALKCIKDFEKNKKNYMDEIRTFISCHNLTTLVTTHVWCYGITRDPDKNKLMMVIQNAPCGSLNEFLENSFDNFSWHYKIEWLHQLVIGLMWIHKAGLLHRDLHSGNCLVLNAERDPILISDFGMCHVNNDDDRKNGYVTGVVPYMAPELLRCEPHTQKSDIYGLGIIMWEMTTGVPAFHDQNHDYLAQQVCLNGKRPEVVPGTPECYARLMRQCWDPDPAKRPTAKRLYKEVGILYSRYLLGFTPVGDIGSQFSDADVVWSRRYVFAKVPALKNPRHPKAEYKSHQITRNQTMEATNPNTPDTSRPVSREERRENCQASLDRTYNEKNNKNAPQASDAWSGSHMSGIV